VALNRLALRASKKKSFEQAIECCRGFGGELTRQKINYETIIHVISRSFLNKVLSRMFLRFYGFRNTRSLNKIYDRTLHDVREQNPFHLHCGADYRAKQLRIL
jgi:hypothetical protein